MFCGLPPRILCRHPDFFMSSQWTFITPSGANFFFHTAQACFPSSDWMISFCVAFDEQLSSLPEGCFHVVAGPVRGKNLINKKIQARRESLGVEMHVQRQKWHCSLHIKMSHGNNFPWWKETTIRNESAKKIHSFASEMENWLCPDWLN